MFNNRWLWIALVVVAFASAVSPAWSFTDSEIEQKVKGLLVQRHPSETGDWWTALGSNAPGVIIHMYQQTDNIYWQTRLVGGLAWFKDSPEAANFLKQQANTTDDGVIREVALSALGISQGPKELDF